MSLSFTTWRLYLPDGPLFVHEKSNLSSHTPYSVNSPLIHTSCSFWLLQHGTLSCPGGDTAGCIQGSAAIFPCADPVELVQSVKHLLCPLKLFQADFGLYCWLPFYIYIYLINATNVSHGAALDVIGRRVIKNQNQSQTPL